MLSVAIIAKDESRYIAGCIESVLPIADEVIVLLDERTSDNTAEICRGLGAQVFIEAWRGFSAQRNRALALCSQPWVLFIDGDERLTPELREEIVQTLQVGPKVQGFWIPRFNIFFGKRLRGGGWYPDHQLRLLLREAAHYDESRFVHEYAEIAGETDRLKQHFLHYNIDRVGEFWRKQTAFACSEADTMLREGRRARLRNFVGAPAREFLRRFVREGGWRDGALGLFLSLSLAFFEVVKFWRIWKLQSS